MNHDRELSAARDPGGGPSVQPDAAGSLRTVAVTLAALGVVAQGVGLLAAIRFVPRFRIAFEDLGAPLTVLSEMIQRYWPSAAFLAVSVLVLGLALWGSRRVLIGVAVVAVLLPIVHAVILVAALYLPLLEVVETLGT